MSASKSQQNLSSRYSTSSVTSKKSSNNNYKVIIAMVVSVIAIIAIMVVIIGNGGNGVDANSYNLVVTPDNIEELKATNSNQTHAANSYDVCMNSTWTFANARSASKDAYVENVLSNTNTVKFSVTRSDTGTIIYESPYIPVGSSLKNIKLTDETLTKGTYPCVVQYQLVDENYQRVSTVSISVSIVIKAD